MCEKDLRMLQWRLFELISFNGCDAEVCTLYGKYLQNCVQSCSFEIRLPDRTDSCYKEGCAAQTGQFRLVTQIMTKMWQGTVLEQK
jgi:hypothetical protein